MARRIKQILARIPWTWRVCFLLSLFLHLFFYTSLLIDWDLLAQLRGLRAALSELQVKVEAQPSPPEKIEVVLEEVQEAVKDGLAAWSTGKPLRLGPTTLPWQETLAQREQATAQKTGSKAGGPTDLEFESPRAEVTDEPLVELIAAQDLPEEVQQAVDETRMAAAVEEMKTMEFTSKCPRDQSYGGIGIIYHPVSRGNNIHEVVKVGEGYPAARAGILPGDLILINNTLKGPPNTDVVVTYFHRGRKREVTMQRQIVCVSKSLGPESTSPGLPVPGVQP